MISDEVDVAAILQESINSSVVDRNRIATDYGDENCVCTQMKAGLLSVL